MSAPDVIVSGIGFTEGPLWTQDGRLLVVSMSRGLIYQIDIAAGEASVVAEVGGGPNGLAQTADGIIWIAQNGGRHQDTSSATSCNPGIQRWDRAGLRRVAAEESFSAPNDCAVGRDGRVWFTDPRGAPFEGEFVPGRVWAFDPPSEEIQVVIEGCAWPNGLAFNADGSEVFVAETRARRITRYAVAEADTPQPSLFANLEEGSPDGIALDAEGLMYVAVPDANAVFVLDPGGRLVESLSFATVGFPTNLCFGGSSLTTLFITAAKGGAVLAIERDTPGLALLQ